MISEIVIGMGGAAASMLAGWARLYLPRHATYPGVPSYRFTVLLLLWALLAGPLIGLIASGYIRLIGCVTHHAAVGRAAVFAPVAAFGILGLVGFAYPLLFDNGKDMASDAAAMLGAAMQAPLTGLALMLELTVGGFGIMIPMVAATVTATVVARRVDGYSIYTARLRAR